MIIPVWKKIGQSTHLLAKKTGEEIAEETKNSDDAKATHTGTLDPMAEGIVVVLTGEDRFKKGNFSDWKKIYEFEILFGTSTDSLDLLGLNTEITTQDNLENFSDEKLSQLEEELGGIIPDFIGKQKQLQPKFSAQRVSGRSGFDLAKQKQKFEVKENKIEIFSLKILDRYSLTLKELETIINQKITSTKGNFRQNQILNNWRKTFTELKKLQIENLPIIKLKATVSKRTYIRSLVRDLSKKLEIPVTTFSIIRTSEGPYGRNSYSTKK